MEIGKRIKELRITKNLSQKQLAEKIHVTQQVIALWETGKHEPKASYIYNLASFFGVTADYLIGLEDETGAKIRISDSFNNNSGNINFKA